MERREPLAVALQPDAPYKRLLVPGQTAGLKSGLVRLLPGEAVGEHETGAKEEVIVVLEGSAVRVTYGESGSLAVSKNHVVYMPAFTRHDVRNDGADTAVYVYVTSPLAEQR